MQDYLKNKEVKLFDFISSTKNFLYEKFGITDKTFSYANPLGQLMLVSSNISRVVLFYIKDASNQTSFSTANRTHTVHGLAQLQGHNAQRGMPARTVVRLEIRPEFRTSDVVGKILLADGVKMVCINNNLPFIARINHGNISIDMNSNPSIEFIILQGEKKTAEFSSDGRDIQSYTITALPNEMIDDDFLNIEVGGRRYNRYESMRDSIFMDRFVMVKTGITSGVDISFGKSRSHTIPKEGDLIQVSYLTHKGAEGNIQNPMFKFIDTAVDELGNQIDLNKAFIIHSIDGTTYMGSEPEDIDTTKAIAPNVSVNSIIHDEKSFRYYIQKMNLFSNMKIIRSNNTLTAMLYPRLKDKVAGGSDYFSMDINSVLLSNVEKARILEHISDKVSNSIEIDIINPNIVRFGMNLVIEAFRSSKESDEFVVSEVRRELSRYMINLKRLNKIPQSDIARILDSIPSVDSVNMRFITENDSHIDELGNLSVDDKNITMLRGGFFSNGVFIEDSFDTGDNSFVNIEIRWV